eukprot:m.257603 g.257603  ORF g.257603 m.257603 type:complete len:962 (+) comp15531_c0_seq3:579-3464(+)
MSLATTTGGGWGMVGALQAEMCVVCGDVDASVKSVQHGDLSDLLCTRCTCPVCGLPLRRFGLSVSRTARLVVCSCESERANTSSRRSRPHSRASSLATSRAQSPSVYSFDMTDARTPRLTNLSYAPQYSTSTTELANTEPLSKQHPLRKSGQQLNASDSESHAQEIAPPQVAVSSAPPIHNDFAEHDDDELVNQGYNWYGHQAARRRTPSPSTLHRLNSRGRSPLSWSSATLRVLQTSDELPEQMTQALTTQGALMERMLQAVEALQAQQQEHQQRKQEGKSQMLVDAVNDSDSDAEQSMLLTNQLLDLVAEHKQLLLHQQQLHDSLQVLSESAMVLDDDHDDHGSPSTSHLFDQTVPTTSAVGDTVPPHHDPPHVQSLADQEHIRELQRALDESTTTLLQITAEAKAHQQEQEQLRAELKDLTVALSVANGKLQRERADHDATIAQLEASFALEKANWQVDMKQAESAQTSALASATRKALDELTDVKLQLSCVQGELEEHTRAAKLAREEAKQAQSELDRITLATKDVKSKAEKETEHVAQQHVALLEAVQQLERQRKQQEALKKSEIQQYETECAAIRDDLQRLRDELMQVTHELGQSRAQVSASRAAVEKANADTRLALEGVKEAQQEFDVAQAALFEMQEQVQQQRQSSEALKLEVAAILAAREDAKKETKRLEAQRKDAEDKLKAAQEALSGVEEQRKREEYQIQQDRAQREADHRLKTLELQRRQQQQLKINRKNQAVKAPNKTFRIQRHSKKTTDFGFEVEGGHDIDGLPCHVSKISEHSAAADAGIQVGDFIVSINGQPYAKAIQSKTIAALRTAGRTGQLSVSVHRDYTGTLLKASQLAILAGASDDSGATTHNRRLGRSKSMDEGTLAPAVDAFLSSSLGEAGQQLDAPATTPEPREGVTTPVSLRQQPRISIKTAGRAVIATRRLSKSMASAGLVTKPSSRQQPPTTQS